MKRRASGFTVIELLIVMVVIAILVAVVIPQLFGTKEKSFVAAMRSDLRNLQTSEEAYFSDWQVYTSNLANLGRMFLSSPNVTVTIDSATATGWGANATHTGTSQVCTIAASVQHTGIPVCP
jgi:prepilin-type N-terminal cleavage/methylation domain-containing protein